jgi:phospholipid-binding lipoprotein MlaA
MHSDGTHMTRWNALLRATPLSLALVVSACANGGVRPAVAPSTVLQASTTAAAVDPTQTGTNSVPLLPASNTNAADAPAVGDTTSPDRPQIQAGATQAELDFNAIYSASDDPIADANSLTPSAVAQSYDPWEKFNRRVYSFNAAIDHMVAKPLARTYARVVPAPARTGVTNFFNNLGQPVTIVNALLQGKGKEAVQSMGRLALNTTVGIGGLFDPATRANIPNRREDFGQTLGVWGWKRSRYLELPLLGPSTVRDAFGIAGDAPLSPLRYIQSNETRLFLQGLKLFDLRTRLFPLDNMLVGATDEYALVRDSWLQRRAYMIARDRHAKIDAGQQPLPDYLRQDDSKPSVSVPAQPRIPGN